MKLCHSLYCKLLFSHRTLHMASASRNLKQKKELLVFASDPSCGKAGSYHTETLLSVHQNKFCHLHGHRRCSNTEAIKCAPHDSHIDAFTDGHRCSSSFENGDALCDQSDCFSKCHNDASDDVFATTEILYDDVGRDVVHEDHDKYANNCFVDSLSITDIYDATSHDKARFDEIVRKSSTNGDVQHGLSAESMDDVNECHEMALNTGSVDDVDKEMKHCNGDLQKRHGNFFNIRSKDGAEKVMHISNGDSQHASDVETLKPAKRPFCKRCEKAQNLCICNRFNGVVQNKIKIIILQNPKEKHHAVGSARVALLGLENVALIDVPEIYSKETFRIRSKVPGSKRSLAGRGGKKILLKGGKLPVIAHDVVPSQADVLQMQNLLTEIFDSELNARDTSQFPLCPNENGETVRGVTPQDKLHDSMHSEGSIDGVMHKSRPPKEISGLLNGNVLCGNEVDSADDRGCVFLEDLETLIPHGVALLYPSDKAIELSQPLQNLGSHNEQEVKAPCHLIVLDGTWSKARRIYFENPWLQTLPHYKLSLPSPSLYEGVRKQPKPGCLSTLESIVYALKVLEPDTEGLDGLLEVFDSMVEDQRRCKQMKCVVQEYGTG